MVAFAFNGVALLKASIYEPRYGVWTADVEVDTAEDLGGDGTSVTIELGDLEFVGTVLRGGVDAGRYLARVEGGAGGLDDIVDPKNYVAIPLSEVVADIVAATGDVLADDSQDLSEHIVANWHRSRGPASYALQAVADELGIPWRVTRAGELRLGVAEFEDAELEFTEITQSPDFGSIIIAPTVELVEPGQNFLDRPVGYAATIFEAGQTRQELFFDDSSSTIDDRVKGALLAIIDHVVGRRLAFLALWPATVNGQAADGTLELTPDDQEIAGTGLASIKIRHGEPGYETKVSAGARCMVGFEAGDPKRPYVAQWLEASSVDELRFDGGVEDIARTNDTVQVGELYLFESGGVTALFWRPVVGSGSWAPVVAGAVIPSPATPGTAIVGDITSGNPKLKA